MKPKVLIDRKELSERWMVSHESLKRYEVRGILHPVKIAPRLVRYRLADIEAIEASRDEFVGGMADMPKPPAAPTTVKKINWLGAGVMLRDPEKLKKSSYKQGVVREAGFRGWITVEWSDGSITMERKDDVVVSFLHNSGMEEPA